MDTDGKTALYMAIRRRKATVSMVLLTLQGCAILTAIVMLRLEGTFWRRNNDNSVLGRKDTFNMEEKLLSVTFLYVLNISDSN